MTLLLPLMLVSRLRERRGGRFDPMRELHLSHTANRVFRRVTDLERAMIRAGIRFPVGGSALLVARKP